MTTVPGRTYRLSVYGSAWVGGMKYGAKYGRTKDPAQALTFSDRREADAAALEYDAWVQTVDQPQQEPA